MDPGRKPRPGPTVSHDAGAAGSPDIRRRWTTGYGGHVAEGYERDRHSHTGVFHSQVSVLSSAPRHFAKSRAVPDM